MYTLSATATTLGAADPEPNDDAAAAIDFDPSAGGVTGRLERAGDVDSTGSPWTTRWPRGSSTCASCPGRPDIAHELCLLDADGNRLQCRRADGPVSLPSLFLTPGDYGISVTGDPDPDAQYVLRLEPTTTPGARLRARAQRCRSARHAGGGRDGDARLGTGG